MLFDGYARIKGLYEIWVPYLTYLRTYVQHNNCTYVVHCVSMCVEGGQDTETDACDEENSLSPQETRYKCVCVCVCHSCQLSLILQDSP